MVFRRKSPLKPEDKTSRPVLLTWRHVLPALLLTLLLFFSIQIYMVLNSDLIYPGITVDDFDVGGMTREQALDYLRDNTGNIIRKDGIILITPQQQYRLPFHDIGYSALYGKSLDMAYSQGRQGGILKRLLAISKLRRQGLRIYSEMWYNKNKTLKVLDSIRQDIEKKPINASITVKGGRIKVTPHQTGLVMDMEQSLDRVEKSLLGRTLEDVELCVIEILPELTTPMVDQITYRLGEFHTSFNIANESRAHNIKTACEKIDQKLLLPGQVFSMDKALGDRTEKNGYKQAKVIINNEMVDGLGGGICQVTSTFYNAVLLSGLEVVERRNHSLPLSYIDVGRDATISEGYIDFRFKNNLGYAILIEAKAVSGQVSVTIWGCEPQEKSRIRIRTKIIEKIEAKGVESQVDPSLKKGETVLVREAIPGCRVEVYRDTLDSTGKVIKTEKISEDRYLPQKKKVKISPFSLAGEAEMME